jgi:hypothetical protein
MKRKQQTDPVTLPAVTVKMRKTYTVSWWFNACHCYGETNIAEPHKTHHTKSFLTKRGAYRHMAVGYVIARRSANGCEWGKCGCEEVVGIDPNGYETIRQCKYCDPDSFARIVERLARRLMWRDRKRGVL